MPGGPTHRILQLAAYSCNRSLFLPYEPGTQTAPGGGIATPMNEGGGIGELCGLRLALYDAALSAGPRGLTAEALHELAQPPGWTDQPTRSPEECTREMDWLRRQGWLVEYQPGRYRATPEKRADTAAPAPEYTKLRTPAFEPSRATAHGQLKFF